MNIFNKLPDSKLFKKLEGFYEDIMAIYREPGVRLLPAHLAFFVVLSMFPVLIIVFFCIQFFDLPIQDFNTPLQYIVPDVVTTILDTTQEKVSTLSIGIWLIVALFVGSNGMSSMVLGASSLYEFELDNYVIRRLKALFLTLLLVVIVLLGIAIIGFGEYLANLLTGSLQIIVGIVRWALVALVAFVAVRYVYIVTPHGRTHIRYTTHGSLFTIFGWLVATIAYTFYYTNFSNYGQMYGSLANIIVLMMWIYILTWVFVGGMILNVYQFRKALASRLETNKKKETSQLVEAPLSQAPFKDLK